MAKGTTIDTWTNDTPRQFLCGTCGYWSVSWNETQTWRVYPREMETFDLSADSKIRWEWKNSKRESDWDERHLPLVPRFHIQSPVNPIEEQPTKAWDENNVRNVE